MLEHQGKDALHDESFLCLSLINIYKSSCFQHTHCPSLVFCQECSCVCVVLITRVCVTCESTDMSKATPGMETRWGTGDCYGESTTIHFLNLYIMCVIKHVLLIWEWKKIFEEDRIDLPQKITIVYVLLNTKWIKYLVCKPVCSNVLFWKKLFW